VRDKYLMDGHKLYWHLDRVNDWANGKSIAPIHIDVGLSKGCNIKCEYCFGELQGNFYKEGAANFFPKDALLRYVREAGECGVRSMAFIGEGEPLLNPFVYEAVVEGKKAGVDIAIGTNGILYDTSEKGVNALRALSWIRFNISAASDEAYQRVHNSKEFDVAISKIAFCVETKRRLDLPVTIGLQMVLTPGDADQAVPLAKLGKKLGVDYLAIKQCSDTVDSDLGVFSKLGTYNSFSELLHEAESQSSDGYDVIVKWVKLGNAGARCYGKCLGVPFLLYSSGDGKLYPCGMCFDTRRGMEEDYRMGDLTRQSFREIINSDRYREVIGRVRDCVDVNKCYSNCRTHAINEFLWRIQNKPQHINFV